jgi:hypothetical protein
MVRIDFTGAGQYWLRCPEPTDPNGGVPGGGALWIDLGECETEADLVAAVPSRHERVHGGYPRGERVLVGRMDSSGWQLKLDICAVGGRPRAAR